MMLSLTCNDFNEAYPLMIQGVLHHGTDLPSRVAPCREISPVMVEVRQPANRLVTAAGRPVNAAFALAEVLWILQGRCDVRMLKHYNSSIDKYSDDGTDFNAAYGHRLRHAFGLDQLAQVERVLREDPATRQASLVLSHPVRDRAYDGETAKGPKHATLDRACNVYSHLMIRDGALNWLQVLRSNDAMWGTPYNWMQFTHIQEWLATRLGVPMGKYTHVVDSLHIYDYHLEQARTIEGYDLYDITGASHLQMEDCSDATMMQVYEAEHNVRHGRPVQPGLVDDYWLSVLWVLKAHYHYKAGEDRRAFECLVQEDVDPIYAAAQMRFYHQHRWHRAEFQHLQDSIFEYTGPDAGTWITTRHEE